MLFYRTAPRGKLFVSAGKYNQLPVKFIEQSDYAFHLIIVAEGDDDFTPAPFI